MLRSRAGTENTPRERVCGDLVGVTIARTRNDAIYFLVVCLCQAMEDHPAEVIASVPHEPDRGRVGSIESGDVFEQGARHARNRSVSDREAVFGSSRL